MNQTVLYKRYQYLTLILSTLFLAFFYGTVLLAPNSYLFEPYGDAINQYFCFSYYIKFNDGWIDNEGIFYPYHEHHVYTDGQPLIAFIFRVLTSIFPALNSYTVGFLNLTMLFSIWVTPMILFGIMKRLKISPLLACLGAIGVNALAPQIFRLAGHFALSYSCLIPLLIYLLIRFEQAQKKTTWGILLFTLNIAAFFIHPYMGLMLSMFTGLIWLVHFVKYFKGYYKKWQTYVFPLVTVFLPVLLFKLFMDFTDVHLPKSEVVIGFLDYCGEPDDTFLPNRPPLEPLFIDLFNLKHKWEALAYVGMVTNIALIWALVVWIIYRIKKKTKQLVLDSKITTLFIAAIPLLLFSWAFPFKQIPELIEYIDPIKQFRSVGRFAWVFYFAATLFSLYLVNRLVLRLKKSGQKALAVVLMFAVPLFYFYEGFAGHWKMKKQIIRHHNSFIEEYTYPEIREALAKINPQDYQAILPLPLYCHGSGNYYRPMKGGAMLFSKSLSMQTGLPIFGGAIARASVWQSKNTLQFTGSNYYRKIIADDLPNDKPILIARSNPGERPNYYEQKILNRATRIAGKDNYVIFEMSLEDLLAIDTTPYQNFNELEQKYQLANDWWASDSTFVYFNGFEDQPAEQVLMGEGAYSGAKEETQILANIDVQKPSTAEDRVCKLSLWVYTGIVDAVNYCGLEIFHAQENKYFYPIVSTNYIETPIIRGDWSMIEMYFNIPNNHDPNIHKIQIRHRRCSQTEGPVYFDNLLVYQVRADVFKFVDAGKNGESLIYNGHIVQKNGSN